MAEMRREMAKNAANEDQSELIKQVSHKPALISPLCFSFWFRISLMFLLLVPCHVLAVILGLRLMPWWWCS